jgi:dienelactone hydrolase
MLKRRSTLLAILAALPLAAAAGAAYLLRDPLPHFLARRSSLASTVESPPSIEGGYSSQPVRVVATSGLAVELVVRRPPLQPGERLPLVVILGGHYTGRDAAKLVGDVPGVIVAALSYPFTGDLRPSAATFLREIPKIRAAFLDTPPAVMLALDYLLARPDVDSTHVEALGVSLGAPFMSIAGALDRRVTRVWALHGSGGSYVPLEAAMRRTIHSSLLRVPAAFLANTIIAGPRLDPVRWAPMITPRPFMMVNALDDERLPRRAVDALYASAREPKEMIWMPGAHIHADSATVRRLVEIVIARVRSDAADR